MLHTCMARSEKKCLQALPHYKHIAYVVKKRKILAEEVNQYGGKMNTFHAEQCALKRCELKWREKDGYCSLRGR